MYDQLIADLQLLAARYQEDVKRAVIRALRTALDGTSTVDADRTTHAAAIDAEVRTSRVNSTSYVGEVMLSALRSPHPHSLTAEVRDAIRTRVIASIRQQPGQSTSELARTLGLPTAQLRRQLHRLVAEGVISIEEHALGGCAKCRRRGSRQPHCRAVARGRPLRAGGSRGAAQGSVPDDDDVVISSPSWYGSLGLPWPLNGEVPGRLRAGPVPTCADHCTPDNDAGSA